MRRSTPGPIPEAWLGQYSRISSVWYLRVVEEPRDPHYAPHYKRHPQYTGHQSEFWWSNAVKLYLSDVDVIEPALTNLISRYHAGEELDAPTSSSIVQPEAVAPAVLWARQVRGWEEHRPPFVLIESVRYREHQNRGGVALDHILEQIFPFPA